MNYFRSINLVITLGLLQIFTSCGISQQEYDELKEENELLKTELESCLYGAEKLLSQLVIAFEEEDFPQSKSLFNEIQQRHPHSEHYNEAKQIL
jgi:hypothetical protein